MGAFSEKSQQLRELLIFAGSALGALGAKLLEWRTVGYVECNPYCQSVLEQRIHDGWLDDAPVWSDARTFDGRPWRGYADLVSAGFPCQPFSSAGEQGAGPDPQNMWDHTARIIREVRPKIVFLENVPGLLAGSHGYFGTVLGDLAEGGFDAVWQVLPARAVGAPHKRDRLWVLACDTHQDCQSELAKYAEASRLPGVSRQVRGWPDPPEGLGMDDGCAHRMDRLKALGNGQVPQQMAAAFALLSARLCRILEAKAVNHETMTEAV